MKLKQKIAMAEKSLKKNYNMQIFYTITRKKRTQTKITPSFRNAQMNKQEYKETDELQTKKNNL